MVRYYYSHFTREKLRQRGDTASAEHEPGILTPEPALLVALESGWELDNRRGGIRAKGTGQHEDLGSGERGPVSIMGDSSTVPVSKGNPEKPPSPNMSHQR